MTSVTIIIIIIMTSVLVLLLRQETDVSTKQCPVRCSFNEFVVVEELTDLN